MNLENISLYYNKKTFNDINEKSTKKVFVNVKPNLSLKCSIYCRSFAVVVMKQQNFLN